MLPYGTPPPPLLGTTGQLPGLAGKFSITRTRSRVFPTHSGPLPGLSGDQVASLHTKSIILKPSAIQETTVTFLVIFSQLLSESNILASVLEMISMETITNPWSSLIRGCLLEGWTQSSLEEIPTPSPPAHSSITQPKSALSRFILTSPKIP